MPAHGGGGGTRTRLQRALATAGVEIPVAVRSETRMAGENAFAASRIVVCAGDLIEDEALEEVAAAAVAAGIPIEWELRGALARTAPLVDRVLDASARAEMVEVEQFARLAESLPEDRS